MTNAEIARVFDSIATMLEMDGANTFRGRLVRDRFLGATRRYDLEVAGGTIIGEKVRGILLDPSIRGLVLRAELFLFFTRTANGKREGKAFLARLQERTIDRDTPTTVSSYFAQLKACRRWGKEEPHDLSLIRQPVLLANGDNDRMLPTPNTLDMARRLPNNELVIYPDAGHGGIFQFHQQFVDKALQFLAN